MTLLREESQRSRPLFIELNPVFSPSVRFSFLIVVKSSFAQTKTMSFFFLQLALKKNAPLHPGSRPLCFAAVPEKGFF